MSLDQPEVIRLDLPATFTYLHVVSDCIADMLHQVSDLVDHETLIYNVQLAAHEVCTNIVNHAYSGTGDGRLGITLSLMVVPPRLVIELQDSGRPFELASVPEPDLGEAQIHGYGLFLIRNLMDTVTYTPQAGANQWRLIKKLA